MEIVKWLKNLKDTYGVYLFVVYSVLAILFYPYLLIIEVAPEINFSIFFSILLFLLPVALFFIFFIPAYLLWVNELLIDFFWKNLKLFYDTQGIKKEV